ncbi:hypothetical protein BOTBODRAFT_25926 [Botryobasidium botryosum FD-172 SS1]|uniref:Cation-transporting ATPase n=1 Tax=Botryobasidium botryosum (strain FD-172 SS1) TaxID=930990 RepID=A0A067N0F1_BOTB1|nr:hypothetical protein BOTBODRAFT_25926 [Botryobasidium botryosum FD-172 SS1]
MNVGSDGEEPFDYTDGASAAEISHVLSSRPPALSRRDSIASQIGSAYDDSGATAIFDGDNSVVVPSSVTTMHHERFINWDYRNREEPRRTRRMSTDSFRTGRPSAEIEVIEPEPYLVGMPGGEEVGVEDDEVERVSVRSRGSRRVRRRKSPSPPPTRSVLTNLANLFGRTPAPQSPTRRRRRSMSSRRSSMSSRRSRRSRSRSEHGALTDDYESEEERWGYASGEEDEDETNQLVAGTRSVHSVDSDAESFIQTDLRTAPPSPTSSLPFFGTHLDPIFGDARVDMGDVEPEEPPPSLLGPPSRQGIYLADEDTTVRFVGYEILWWKRWLWNIACVASLGVLALVGLWVPSLWLRWVAREKGFKDLDKNGLIVIETPYQDFFIHELLTLEYPYPYSSVFPPPIPTASSSAPTAQSASQTRASTPSILGKAASHISRDVNDELVTLRAVDYRHTRFALDPKSGFFTMVRDWRDPSWTSIAVVRNGVDEGTWEQRRILFGDNAIDIAAKTTVTLLIEEVLHPFYVFQMASIALWSVDNYYYYAFCIGLISSATIISTLVETRKTIERMREMSRFSCPVGTLVNGSWETVDSSVLVPGDIVNLLSPQPTIIPADMFLLTGDAIVNESMLTGESVPVSKIPVKDDELSSWRSGGDLKSEMAKSFLYTGTKVVRMRGGSTGAQEQQALAVVARTGFNTTKGALIRSMLFPKPMGFKFYRDSMRFIAFLAGLALCGFFASAFQFVKLGVSWGTICVRALDLITVVVPPALPATLSIGTSFAIGRLRKLGIFCISPTRVNIGGKVNVVCFDKTGTLTEDGLDVLGVRSLSRSGDRFGELVSEVRDLPLAQSKANFLYALATCHSLKVIEGETIGDPLDVKMFEFTGWTMEEGQTSKKPSTSPDRPTSLVQMIVRPPGTGQFRLEDALKAGTKHAHFLELGVIRTFEFVSALRRMSVIVKRLKSSSMEIYVKGAPEVMGEICEPDSFPEDYNDLLSYYTNHGYRVIAIAGKSIDGLSWLKAQRMKREQAESGLRFLGLIIFENKLKPGTAPAIQTLRAAHLACRMVTGDNPRTAISVARECGLISQSAHVFQPAFIQGDAQTPESRLSWTGVEDPALKLDDYSLKPLVAPDNEFEEISYQDYSLAVTGDVFRWMINHAPLETLQRMLVKAQIFARMSPDEKHELVERLQSLGYTVAFCGDGANDCGALKAADVGLSLSEAEASVAAPFTSRTPDISCVIEVIREGRAALVTSFSCFKYMALYSLIQFTTITLLYSFASSLGDFQFLYIDLFVIIPVAVSMGWTLPFPRIHPKPPTASLVSKKVLSSIIGQVLLTAALQFWAFFWVRAQPWYEPPGPSSFASEELETFNYENTVLFLVSSFQYILVAAVFSIGPPYRQPMWTNAWLLASLIILTSFSTYVLISPPQMMSLLLDLKVLPYSAKLTLLTGVVLNVLACVAFERWAIVAKVVIFVSKRWRGRRRRVKAGKTYEAVEGGMRG